MSWEEQVAWAGDMATEVGSGRTAKGPECQGSRAAREGSLVRGDVMGVRKTRRVTKSKDSGLRWPEFKSQPYYQLALGPWAASHPL